MHAQGSCKTGLEKSHELVYRDGIVESNHYFWQCKLAATKELTLSLPPATSLIAK